MALTGLYLGWVVHLPVSALTAAGHDDALFWRLAEQIVAGHWLGPYDSLTLAKGPGFPLVLAANHVIGIPITWTLGLLFVTSCGLVTLELARLGLSKSLSLGTFALLLFNPANAPARFTRDDIYASLTLIVVAAALRVLQVSTSRPRSLAVTALLGTALGLLWVTREEGVWIVPGLVVLIGWALLSAKRDRPVLRARALHVTALLLAAAFVVGGIAWVNLMQYGRFIVTDFKDASFSRVVKVLNNAEAGQETPFVPVSASKRQALYAVSPAFAELRGVLEDPANSWKAPGCGIYPTSCGDFAGGWWVWALRDAVAQRGYYGDPTQAAEFYDRVSRQVGDACASGRLTCRSNPIPFMPNLGEEQAEAVPATVANALRLVTLQSDIGWPGPSQEPLPELSRFREFLGEPPTTLALSEQQALISGWFRAPRDGWLDLVCAGAGGAKSRQAVVRVASPDLVQHFKDPGLDANRFSFGVPEDKECRLTVHSSVRPRQIALPSLLGSAPADYELGEGNLHVDSVALAFPEPVAWPAEIKRALVSGYEIAIPLLALGGFLAFLGVLGGRLGKRTFGGSRLLVPVLSLWILLAARIALLVLVDITSFPAINFLYMAPGFPLLILASTASIQLLLDTVARTRTTLGGPNANPANRLSKRTA